MIRTYDPVKRRAAYLRNREHVLLTNRLWYQRHRDRHKVLRETWKANHPDYHREYGRQWYANNREKHLENSRAWSARNAHLKRLYRNLRRARERGAVGECSLEQIEARVAFFGWRCSYCGGPFEELDHAIPLSRGGTRWASNLRPSCQRCNRSKFTSTAREFLSRCT